ncbi:MAG: hypothetical protein QOE11_2705 [Solirubrobacteraceae bacterium]|jgi:hypothetical protein|nr:hypothetical protein [Solirubrobacteraceae bacterium]
MLLGGLLLPATGQAIALSCLVSPSRAAVPAQSALRFGIYPGGGAGSVDPKAPTRPEDPARRLAAVRSLAGSNPFVVRLYTAWTGVAAADDVGSWLDAEIADYAAAGLNLELVVRYKPVTAGGSAPAAFADYVRSIVRRYGPDERFVSLQVTNEANMPGAPDASDGAFAGAAQALVDGVVAAKDQVRRDGHDQVRIGFSWAYDERPLASGDFWATLGRLGGSAFADAVDWVGLDSYPGTWAPQLPLSDLLPGLAAIAVKDSARSLRECFMPMAGLGSSTTIHLAENGFPTGPGRSEQLQAQVLAAMVRGVDAIRDRYGVSDYRWFDLRDSATADPSIESQYGITRDDYSPKPAFATYRDLIAAHGGGAAGPVATSACTPSPVKVAVPRWKGRRVTSLVVRVGTKVAKRVRRSRMPRVVRVRMQSGLASVRLELTARARAHKLTRVLRRTYAVC